MKSILLAVLLAACTREVKRDFQLDTTETDKTVLDTEKEVAKTKSQAPTDVDTKTTKSDLAVIVEAPDGSLTVAEVQPHAPLTLKKGSKVVGTVATGTTTVDQARHIGAATTTETTDAKAHKTDDVDKNAKAKTHEETATEFLGWKFYLSCILGLVVLLVGAYAYLKFIKKVCWL